MDKYTGNWPFWWRWRVDASSRIKNGFPCSRAKYASSIASGMRPGWGCAYEETGGGGAKGNAAA